jgi:serine/threonine protein kinase
MGTFFEQLAAALAPEFLLERELGSGGMGTVFLARDVALDRPVAIKVVRPEDASAAAVERFQEEARTLARLRHSHIVPVHATGLARGLGTPFYVMDVLVGQTLEERLRQGTLAETDAARLCDQLLDALAVAHRHGIVHRDIKPSNVFLEEGGAILTDFGIAKRLDRQDGALTKPGQPIGTPLYSPPEQAAGRGVTPQTDLHALAMVMYEALTGRTWLLEPPGAPSWDGVGERLRPVLERALADSPAQRWPDAQAFQRAWQAATRRPTVGMRLRSIAIPVLVVATAWLFWPRAIVSDLRVEALAVNGRSPMPSLGDSLGALVARRLTGFPDFTVQGPGRSGRARDVIRGSVTVSGPSLRITMRLRERQFTVTTATDDWQAAGDLLADSLLLRVFSGTALDLEVPVRVLPRDPEGLQAFLGAEKLFAAAHWREAYAAYDAAIAVDSTCWLCVWRHNETSRWLGQDDDSAGIHQALVHIALFPPAYQSLIRVDTLPLLARFDTLDALHQRSPSFLFGEFRYGDELMHRGPLIGRARREAAQYFQAALNLRPDFAPAVEHQLWLAVLEEDGPGARAAREALFLVSQQQQLTSGVPEMLQAAYAWRFLSPPEASALTQQALDAARRKGIGALDVGARYLNGFMTPLGAVWIGKQLEPDPRYGRSALIAQVFGHLEMGRLESAAMDLDRLRARYPDPGTALLRLELEGVRRMFVTARDDSSTEVLAGELSGIASATNLPAGLRQRAGWLADVLSCKLAIRTVRQRPPSGVTYPAVLGGLLTACRQAEAGRLLEAVDSTNRYTELTAWPLRAFPVYRTMLHLLRSDWLARAGRRAAAVTELLWAENFDHATLPSGDPQPMEVDWAFRPWARWRRVELQLSGGNREELCPMAASVERVWRGGDAPFGALADSAARLRAELRCAEPVP